MPPQEGAEQQQLNRSPGEPTSPLLHSVMSGFPKETQLGHKMCLQEERKQEAQVEMSQEQELAWQPMEQAQEQFQE